MHRRKIQLIAGTTYSVSLPKEWVRKNNLKEKNEILFYEKNDRTLVISPYAIEGKKLNEISFDIDKYISAIDQILFAVYYLGIENISLFSKKELTKDVKSRIRKTITHMSGTEINYEDKQKIIMRVLLDKSKVEIFQVLYRINLIIESSILNILEQLNINEIRINENEIDRLYHLITKIISLSIIDSNILNSSKIKNVSLIPAYFLISKRLENIGDNINHLSEYLHKTKVKFENKNEILNFAKTELNRSISYFMSKSTNIFQKINVDNLRIINDYILKSKDKTIQNYLEDIIRYVVDIEEEIVNISFYNQLIHEGFL